MLQLKESRNSLLSKYKQADIEFHRRYSNSVFKDYHRPDEKVKDYLARFDAALSTYAQDNLFFDENSEDYKKIVRMLETAEKDAQLFGDAEEKEKLLFGESLQDLQEELESFVKFLDEEFPVYRQPALVTPAANLLKGGPLEVGAAQKIISQVQQYVNLIKTWQDMAKQIRRYELWAEELQKKEDDMTQVDKEMLHLAQAKLMEAENEMLDAKDAATLADLGAAEDLRHAYGQLAYLGSRYEVWEAPEKGVIRKGGLKLLVTDLLKQAKFIYISPEAVAVVIHRAIRRLSDRVLLALTVAAVTIASLNQFYFGKTFGKLEDYVTVILVGIGTPLAFKVLIDTITQLQKPIKA
jgi:hypothetical protein